MNENRELPYTPPHLVVGADPFRIRRRPIDARHLDGMLGAQKEIRAAQTAEVRREELLQNETEAWSAFFGEPIEVPEPPEELLTFLNYLDDNAIEHMEAHYLPPKEIYSKDQSNGGVRLHAYPGLRDRPSYTYKQMLDGEELVNDEEAQDIIHGDLPGMWIVTDNYSKDEHNEDTDPYADAFKQLYTKGYLKGPRKYGSREDLRRWQVTYGVLPEIADGWDLAPEQIRLISYLEYNILGNAFYPEWGTRTDNTWFRDNRVGEEDCNGMMYRVFESTYGGGVKNGSDGLHNFNCLGSASYPKEDISFKPIIEFPLKK